MPVTDTSEKGLGTLIVDSLVNQAGSTPTVHPTATPTPGSREGG